MAEFYRFFDSTIDDIREYTADEFSEYFRMVLTNGIYNGGTNLQVTAAGGNMTVSIKDGYANIYGYLYKVLGGVTLPIETADVTHNRIDRIVIRWDKREESRYIKAMVLKGVTAEHPTPPELTRTEEIYELSLAQVLVKAGTNNITGDSVTDERLNTEVCGLINSLIQADTTEIFHQFQAWYDTKTPEFEKVFYDWYASKVPALEQDFITWFNGIKAKLDGDTAGNLLKQIQAVASTAGSPNLVPLTNTADTYVRAYGNSIVTTRERGDGAVIGRCTAEDSATHALGLRIGSQNGVDMPIKLKKGVKYTLSFKARTNKAMRLNYVYILNKTTANISLQNSLNPNSIDENFAKYYVTFTYNGEDDEGSLVMIALARSGNADLATGDYIEVVDVTITEGEVPHNWSPSPQDAKDAITELQQGNTLSVIKSGKDDNGIYTTITYKRKPDNTTYATSVLSGGTSPLYTTRTLSFYNAAGTQISEKYTYSLSYDEDDELISEV